MIVFFGDNVPTVCDWKITQCCAVVIVIIIPHPCLEQQRRNSRHRWTATAQYIDKNDKRHPCNVHCRFNICVTGGVLHQGFKHHWLPCLSTLWLFDFRLKGMLFWLTEEQVWCICFTCSFVKFSFFNITSCFFFLAEVTLGNDWLFVICFISKFCCCCFCWFKTWKGVPVKRFPTTRPFSCTQVYFKFWLSVSVKS